ncbi:hypothetical protein [Streptomyces sp. NPDC021020]|uniref:hypothetical protein n=1 Tax=Streptomyces sp. NPDC021020 TaxID=3365109 RepID=UPI0037B54929
MTGSARVHLDTFVREGSLGKGGQGEVWGVKERKINKEWPVAYKQYTPGIRATADFTALQAMVDFVPALDPPVGRWLCERSAWPAAVVEDDRGPCGFLMRRVPDTFTLHLPAPVGKTSLAAFQFLFNSQDYLDRMAIRITDLHRLLLLRDLAGLMGRLHELGIAVGDLSANNLMFSLAPQPACFFIDCDAMRLHGRQVLPQAETAGWQVPDPTGEELGTPESDRYKYSLLAIRLFRGEQESTDSDELGNADPALAQLATSGQSADPLLRPTMHEWAHELEEVIARNPLGRSSQGPRVVHPTTASPARARNTVPPGGPPRGGTVPPKPVRTAPRLVTALAVFLLLFGPPHLYRHLSQGLSGAPHVTASADTGDTGDSTHSDDGGSGSDSSDDSTEESQVAAVDDLLQSNVDTRQSVQAAVASVIACKSLPASATVFAQAAASRRDLLGRLADLDVGSVPGGSDALRSLATAWTASAAADDHYQEWAQDLARDGCGQGRTTQATAFQQAGQASDQATAAKKMFVAQWNPIANRNGLPGYSWDAI